MKKKKQINLMQDPKFLKIKHRKLEAYKHTISDTIKLLRAGSPDAYEIIKHDFDEFERRLAEEEDYIERAGQLSALQVLYTYKTPQDIHWVLPEDVKPLWEANAKLEAWRKQYR